jgi:GntR family transcriptional regulator
MALAKPVFARHTPTWKVVHGYIEEQIAVGTYPIGSWLPSVRQLALELGINRNTIAKAYQTLGRSGLVELVHGNGVRVVSTKPTTTRDETRIGQQIEAVISEARRHGVSREWVMDRVTLAIDDAYAKSSGAIAFVECTEHDARSIGEDLARHLAVEVQPMVIADLARARASELGRFRFLATTSFHLRDVVEIVGARATRVLGVNFVLSHDSTIAIARIPRHAAVAVVAPNEHTLERIIPIVESVTHGETLACTTEDLIDLREAVARADVVIDVALTHDLVKRIRPEARTITADFHAEPPSMEHVREALRAPAPLGANRQRPN